MKNTQSQKQIKITHNLDLLARQGGEAYAKKHSGVTYTVESVDSDGWAYVRGGKIPPLLLSPYSQPNRYDVHISGKTKPTNQPIKEQTKMKNITTTEAKFGNTFTDEKIDETQTVLTRTNVMRFNSDILTTTGRFSVSMIDTDPTDRLDVSDGWGNFSANVYATRGIAMGVVRRTFKIEHLGTSV